MVGGGVVGGGVVGGGVVGGGMVGGGVVSVVGGGIAVGYCVVSVVCDSEVVVYGTNVSSFRRGDDIVSTILV